MTDLANSAVGTAAPGSIVTPEAVVLEFELAGVASRSVAATLDVIAQALALVGLALAAGAIGAASEVAGIVLLLVGLISILIGYPVAMETMNRGRTLGRMAVGTRVVTVEGAPLRFRHAFPRALLGVLEVIGTGGAVAVVAALLTRRGQRLGDLVAGTMVIHDRRGDLPWYRAFAPSRSLSQWARHMDPSPLGTDGYQLIRDYLRRSELSDEHRARVGTEIEAMVIGRLPGWRRPAGVARDDWLRTIAARAQGSDTAPPPPPSGRPAGSVPPPPPPSP